VFFHPVGYEGRIVNSSESGQRHIDVLFFMLGWDRYGFNEKRNGTRYAKLLFLHPVGSMGYVVHFGASEA
jgi:hypothetical protein